jgi:hypothetical protein
VPPLSPIFSALRLATARLIADTVFASAYSTLTGDAAAAFVPCDLSNATICPTLESSKPTILALYNQRGQVSDHHAWVPVPVTAGSYAVYGPNGAPVVAQVRTHARASVCLACTSDVATLAPSVSLISSVQTGQTVPASAADNFLRTSYYKYSSPATPNGIQVRL